MPYITSLNSCLNRVLGDGYTDDFKLTVKGIHSTKTNRFYLPQEIKIINSFRFEGNTNPEDNVIMYVIETADGLKGTFVKSYNGSNENKVGHPFIFEGENFNK